LIDGVNAGRSGQPVVERRVEDEAEHHGNKKASQCQGNQHNGEKGLGQRHHREEDESAGPNQ
jgi:hypothetical protein